MVEGVRIWLAGGLRSPLLVAALVGAATFHQSWRGCAALLTFNGGAKGTPFLQIDEAISLFPGTANRPPSSLEEVMAALPSPRISWQDVWGNAIVYKVRGARWTLTSLGRGGKPGGTGFDADDVFERTNYGHRRSPVSTFQPSLAQFLAESSYDCFRRTSVVAAIAAWLPITNMAYRRRRRRAARSSVSWLLDVLIVGMLAFLFGIGLSHGCAVSFGISG